METLSNHLTSRYCDVSKYSVFLDEEERVATFLLFNLSGQIVGIQKYRPEGAKKSESPENSKYFTMAGIEGIESKRKLAVFGLESINTETAVLYVVEGIFDAARLHSLGLSAIAVLSNSPNRLKNFLMCLPFKTISLCDGDEAGKELAELCDESLHCPNGKDPGEMTDDELKNLLNF